MMDPIPLLSAGMTRYCVMCTWIKYSNGTSILGGRCGLATLPASLYWHA